MGPFDRFQLQIEAENVEDGNFCEGAFCGWVAPGPCLCGDTCMGCQSSMTSEAAPSVEKTSISI